MGFLGCPGSLVFFLGLDLLWKGAEDFFCAAFISLFLIINMWNLSTRLSMKFCQCHSLESLASSVSGFNTKTKENKYSKAQYFHFHNNFTFIIRTHGVVRSIRRLHICLDSLSIMVNVVLDRSSILASILPVDFTVIFFDLNSYSTFSAQIMLETWVDKSKVYQWRRECVNGVSLGLDFNIKKTLLKDLPDLAKLTACTSLNLTKIGGLYLNMKPLSRLEDALYVWTMKVPWFSSAWTQSQRLDLSSPSSLPSYFLFSSLDISL